MTCHEEHFGDDSDRSSRARTGLPDRQGEGGLVGLLTGGATPERSVALSGAGQVLTALRSRGYEVIVADTCEGILSSGEEAARLASSVGSQPPSEQELRALEEREDLLAVLAELTAAGVEVVVPVLHGREGEGGLVQAALELSGLPFAGSDAAGAYLAMDKVVAKRLFEQLGVPTARWLLWPASSEEVERLGFPIIVKPSRVGSTVGLSVVEEPPGLDEAIGLALRYDDEVLLEEFLPGREMTVGVLGEQALEVGEIIVPGRVFDFEAKYATGEQAATEIFPAEIPEDLRQQLQAQALLVHRGLKLRHYSRVDFRLDAAGRPRCLEVNTLPGMTQTSLLPKSAAACGIPFPELCARIVELARPATG